MLRIIAKKRLAFLTAIFCLLCLIIMSIPVKARAPVIVIQPGHSIGYDSGAVNNNTGIQEANINSEISGRIATKLKNMGYDVYLTTKVQGCSVPYLLSNVEANSLSKVANAINSKNPDLSLSIHSNSGGATATGYEFYWSSYRTFDKEGVYEVPNLWPGGDMAFRDISPCASAQQSERLVSILESNFEGIGIPHRKTVERDDYVQARTTCPSVLIETGFISNNAESRLLASDSFQNNISSRIVNSINEFVGFSDKEPPKAESVTTPEEITSSACFTVNANNVSDSGSGVKEVKAAVWSDTGWQDDLKWYNASDIGDTCWSAQVDIKNHNNELGKYYIDFWASDYAGNEGYIGGTTVTVKNDTSIPTGISIKKLNESQYKVYAKGYTDFYDFRFPTWSAINDQDDIIWYQGVRQVDGSYAVVVDIKNHNYDEGNYYIHAYASDTSGKQIFLGNSGFNIPKISIDNITVSDISNGKFTVTLSNIEGKDRISKISVPIWSDNGWQDDLKWYTATKASEDAYTVTVDLKDHKYDTGKYYIDVYGTDSKGKEKFLIGTTTIVEPMQAKNVEIQKTNENQFTVKVSGITAPFGIKEILVPVWSDNGWQDDLKWYTANRKEDGSYEVTIDTKDHNYDTGKYYVDVYGKDNRGQKIYLNGATTIVNQMTAKNVAVSEVTDGKFTVTISGIEAPTGISKISVPIWSDNGWQDDLKWYTATKASEDAYTVTVDLKDHKYDTGKYYIDVYGTDSKGKEKFLIGTTTIVEKTNALLTNIMASTTVTSEQLVNLYTSTGNTFPSYYTENGRNVDLNRFAQLYIEEANAEGIRADVAFAQAMKETGWLKFGGQVSISQFNFAGLGATDDGAAGMSFAQKYGDNENGIRMGIRAQIQHLKAYASTEPLNNACVDERFNLVKRGCAPYVEWLGQKENPNGYGWATGANYGQGIIDIMNRIS